MESFQTQNLALATTLATCGVPFYEGSPVINFYTADLIREMRDSSGQPLYRGRSLESAARDAHATGRPGRVVYSFRWTDELQAILDAYNEQSAVMDKEGGPVTLPVIEPAEAARLCCQLLANRRKLRDAWKKAVPMIAVEGATRTENQGNRTVTIGSVKLVSLNASKETRNKVQL